SSTTWRLSARRCMGPSASGPERRDGAYCACCAPVSQAVITIASAEARSSGSRSALTIARTFAAWRPPNRPAAVPELSGGRCLGDGGEVDMATSSQIEACGARAGPGPTVRDVDLAALRAILER